MSYAHIYFCAHSAAFCVTLCGISTIIMQKNLKNIFGSYHGANEKSIEFLIQALDKNNLPGFDYIEFKQSLNALNEQMDMEEVTVFKSAFATASVLGLTKEKLLKTAEHYRAVLSNEKQMFDQALQNQMEQNVLGKQKEVAKLRKQIEEHQKAIAELEKRISAANETIAKADEEIAGHKDKIEGTREAFERTLQSILNQIALDIENINKYL